MKIFRSSAFDSTLRDRGEDGLAVILVMALLAIILVYIAGNLGTLHHLKSDLRLIEQRQVRRLEAISKANTNAGTSSPTTNGTVGAISDSPLK